MAELINGSRLAWETVDELIKCHNQFSPDDGLLEVRELSLGRRRQGTEYKICLYPANMIFYYSLTNQGGASVSNKENFSKRKQIINESISSHIIKNSDVDYKQS